MWGNKQDVSWNGARRHSLTSRRGKLQSVSNPSACVPAASPAHLAAHGWQAGQGNKQGCRLHGDVQLLAQQEAQGRSQQALGAAQAPEGLPVVHALRRQRHLLLGMGAGRDCGCYAPVPLTQHSCLHSSQATLTMIAGMPAMHANTAAYSRNRTMKASRHAAVSGSSGWRVVEQPQAACRGCV